LHIYKLLKNTVKVLIKCIILVVKIFLKDIIMDELLEQPEEVIEEAVQKIDLLPEQKQVVVSVLEWAKRMSKNYGNTVLDKNNKQYDWGQALCRERFGINWESHMRTNNIAIPTQEDLNRALEWEDGNAPDWVKRS
jgi:hypothetical protein